METAAAARLPGSLAAWFGLLTMAATLTYSVTLNHFSSVDGCNDFLGRIKGSWDLITESH